MVAALPTLTQTVVVLLLVQPGTEDYSNTLNNSSDRQPRSFYKIVLTTAMVGNHATSVIQRCPRRSARPQPWPPTAPVPAHP